MIPKVRVMLDSGAYTAYSKKVEIGVSGYADTILRNKDMIFIAVNLDVIGPFDPDDAAKRGRDNFLYLRDRGISVMPVLHASEDLKWLDLMIEDKCDIIGFSASMISSTEATPWYDLVWAYSTDSKGLPIANFHCFGDTSEFSIARYPWYSVDSTTWATGGLREGRIIIDGRAYSLGSRTAAVGKASVEMDDPDLLVSLDKMGINSKILSGTLTQKQLNHLYLFCWVIHFLELEKKSPREYHPGPTLFGPKRYSENGGLNLDKMHMYFGLPGSIYSFLPVLAVLGVETILCSYYYMSAPCMELLHDYVFDPIGVCKSHSKIKPHWDDLQSILL